jgi:phosphocarrier protein HPr
MGVTITHQFRLDKALAFIVVISLERQPVSEVVLRIEHEAGLHARPLSLFVKTASALQSDVQVENLTNGKGPANGKSPLNLMLLTAQRGHQIRIQADGPDSDQAIAALRELIESNFGEEGP